MPLCWVKDRTWKKFANKTHIRNKKKSEEDLTVSVLASSSKYASLKYSELKYSLPKPNAQNAENLVNKHFFWPLGKTVYREKSTQHMILVDNTEVLCSKSYIKGRNWPLLWSSKILSLTERCYADDEETKCRIPRKKCVPVIIYLCELVSS